MTRNHAVFLAALLGMSGLSSLAHAQSCEDDFDCATGTLCVFEGGDDGDVAVDSPAETPVCDGDGCPEPEPQPTPTPRTGKCEPLPKGLCVMQSDCTFGLTCEIGTVGTDCAEPAPVDQGGDQPVDARDECTATERPAPYGYCTLPETKCTTDAECLLGLKCVASSSGETPGATDPACAADDPECGVQTDPGPAPEPKDAQRTCEVAFDDCTANSDCSMGYACVERETGCSSSGSGGSAGSGGSVDPVAPDEPSAAIPKQNDPNCEYESLCLPKLVPCTDDTQCQSGWICYAYEADSPIAEALWEEGDAGKGCLPKGLALAAEASAAADLADGKGSSTGSPEAGADDDEGAGAGEGGGGGGGGMCAVTSGQSHAGALWLLALSLGLVIRRRRA